ncbi:patatin-like phospholipase family protein [Marinobacter arenosus]|uniref:patatin-like phospholipase family protein n=1 Tax=Marinobacter arenosus TaxID=2856822 RepID=UPI001C4D89F1|nr:patatin-like phospholipase family protein [Marinobacter arenosus]MBW0147143.1 patatin-like phospholipase family protein [Marinobacter arenosus]
MALVAGCSAIPERNGVPAGRENDAKIAGIPNARITGMMTESQINDVLAQVLAQQRAAGVADDADVNILALSGGGANGAFGAGLLNGWSAEGSRPEFTIVTAISTGALMAPFAFLGSEYDPYLRKLYTTTDTSSIIVKRSKLIAMRSDALNDSTPLKELVASYIDQTLLDRIAAEHGRGRRLLVGTTNLDAGRGVIWDMGEIAASRRPSALQLFRDILVASASIPVAFPPVYIDVMIDGSRYSEMHVDGGIAAQAFIIPAWMNVGRRSEKEGLDRRRKLFVIRNGTLQAHSTVVQPKINAIAGRSIGVLIKQQGIGDLIRIYSTAQLDDLEFNLAYIPADIKNDSAEAFDPVYMRRLFDLGYSQAVTGYPWQHDIFDVEL